MLQKIMFSLLLLAFPVTAPAQPPPTAQVNEMKKLDYMVGRWAGTGWIEREGRRETFAGTETIQSKLNGLAVLIEGKFSGEVPGSDEEVVVHETLAVLNYDESNGTHRFRTYLANGLTGDYELEQIEGGWQWGFRVPAGSIRYVIKISNEDEWFETGEFSADGATWRQFFEMTLRRAN